jgi:hypothetical protein
MLKKLKTMNKRKFTYILIAVVLIGWVVFRFAAIGSQNELRVFNPARAAIDVGAPVDVITMNLESKTLREPLYVKSNRALVSGARIDRFCAGQHVGPGTIVSVSNDIDLDSGMYVVKTRGVADGLNYAEIVGNGFYVPVSAITNDTVMVVSDGHAQMREIKIARQDADLAMVARGLVAGDVVILSRIDDGTRVDVRAD